MKTEPTQAAAIEKGVVKEDGKPDRYGGECR